VISKPSFLRTLMLTMIAIAAVFSVDTFLARKEKEESRVEGERSYRAGQKAMQQGAPQIAVEQFTTAYAIARENHEYQIALAEALTASGRLPEAEATLSDLLQKDGTNGPANFAMARALVKEGRTAEGISYYHRAIYGQWGQNDVAHRRAARFELVDLLAAQNDKEALLAELLPLQEETPDDAATELKLGRLFIAAGSPARAIPLFRDVLQKNKAQPDAYAGLGEAEFAQDNYRAALEYFLRASDLRPGDSDTQSRIKLCRQLLALDPNVRGLSAEEQERRSLALLDLVLGEIRECTASSSPPARDLVDQAEKARKRRVPPSQQGAAFESNLDLIGKLWQIDKAECGAHSNPSEPVAIIMERVITETPGAVNRTKNLP
jgi:tetratricopeptide (TPR) repeat protein